MERLHLYVGITGRGRRAGSSCRCSLPRQELLSRTALEHREAHLALSVPGAGNLWSVPEVAGAGHLLPASGNTGAGGDQQRCVTLELRAAGSTQGADRPNICQQLARSRSQSQSRSSPYPAHSIPGMAAGFGSGLRAVHSVWSRTNLIPFPLQDTNPPIPLNRVPEALVMVLRRDQMGLGLLYPIFLAERMG